MWDHPLDAADVMIVWHSSFNILKEYIFFGKKEKSIGSRMFDGVFVKYYSYDKN